MDQEKLHAQYVHSEWLTEANHDALVAYWAVRKVYPNTIIALFAGNAQRGDFLVQCNIDRITPMRAIRNADVTYLRFEMDRGSKRVVFFETHFAAKVSR